MKFVIVGFVFFYGVVAVQSQTVPVVNVTANYSKITSSIDKAKVLNVARGGHGINTDLTWMPNFYDKLVEIGVDEFRIDWLLSDWFYSVVSRDASGKPVCDFTKLDKIILPLARKGIKPVMCLCYMASALGNQEGPPNDFDEYKTVVSTYVRHYKDSGFTGWAWESHNEPEGFTKLSAAQTYQMYEYFARGVKEADPTARVGGYGSVGHDWIGYVRSFLDCFKKDATKPGMDFFSFHQYGKPGWDYVPEIESAFTAAGLPAPDFYITEWNNSYGPALGEGNGGVAGGGFDTHINAAYIAKKLHASFQYPRVKKIHYWNFADADPSTKFCGDPGLFTVDAHRKAGANTFYFYNNLFSSVASAAFSGAGTTTRDVYGIVTVDTATKKTAILYWNYQTTAVTINTVLNNLPAVSNGSYYKVKKLAIDSMNGNYYYDHANGYSGTAPGPHEYAKIVDSSTVSGTTLSRSDIVPRFGVVQFLVEPRSMTTGLTPIIARPRYSLEIFPAVFNRAATVTYTNEGLSAITLSLVAVNGKLVKLVESGDKPAGRHTVRLGDSIKGGMYLLILKSANTVRVVKVIMKL